MKLPSCPRARPIEKMPQTAQYRGGVYLAAAAMLAAFGVAGACAQAPRPTLPPTPPTALPAPIAALPAGTAQPASQPHRAQVTYTGGELNVRADNSSLNQILRAISRRTGLKITGGVQDQRVFGDYGPAPASTVLATLLDGTGTNILLLGGDATNPPELILTPRAGGPTPPGPDSAAYAMYDEGPNGDSPAQPNSAQPNSAQPNSAQPSSAQPAQRPAGQTVTPQAQGISGSPNGSSSGPPSIPQPLNNVNGSSSNTSPTASTLPVTHSVPLDSVPTPSTTPSTSGIVDAPNPPAPGSTTGTNPNGTLTPQQVAQELLKLQQQQQQSKPSGTSPQQ